MRAIVSAAVAALACALAAATLLALGSSSSLGELRGISSLPHPHPHPAPPSHATHIQRSNPSDNNSNSNHINATNINDSNNVATDLNASAVFAPGDGGFACWRIPALVRTAKGSLLAFAEARSQNCNDDSTQRIGVRRSHDGGRTWSKVAFAAGDSQSFVGNPYPIALSSGRVVLIFVNVVNTGGRHYETSGNGLVWSEDDGMTWGPSIDVSKQFGAASGSMPGPGAGLQLASGRLLVVLHHGGYREDFVVYSDDEGQTWTTESKGFSKMDEAAMAELGNGEVLISLRSLTEPLLGRAFARSLDGGLTWSDIYRDHSLRGPICQGSLAAINQTVFFAEPTGRGRKDLTLHRSDDGGRTWAAKRVIVSQATAGYSSIALGVDDQHGGLLHEGVRPGSIVYTNFTLDLGFSTIGEFAL